MMKAKKLKCYIYTRVSTEMQTEGFSLEAQKDLLVREAKHRDMKIMGEYCDEGKSGTSVVGRPEFKRMMQDIVDEKDEIDYVLVFKLSRFGRNAADTLNALQIMQMHGANLICVKDAIDSSAGAGKLIISVLAAVAEIEHENILEQTMSGRVQKAKSGYWNGGQAPFGYRLEYVNGTKFKQFVIDEEEAKLVALIFDKYAHSHMGTGALAKWLNEQGYKRPLRQNTTKEVFTERFIAQVLDRPLYMGKLTYGVRKQETVKGSNEKKRVKQSLDVVEMYDGQHEAIIDEETWYVCQAKRRDNGGGVTDKTHDDWYDHLLSGLLLCPVCGGKLYGMKQQKKNKRTGGIYKPYYSYRCGHQMKVDGKSCVFKRYVQQEQIDNEVMALVKWIWSTDDFKKKFMLHLGNDDEYDEIVAQRDRLKAESTKLEAKQKKLVSKLVALDVDSDTYDIMYDSIETAIQELGEQKAKADANLMNAEIAVANASNEHFSATQLYDMLLVAIDNLDDIDREWMKRILQVLIAKIEIYPEKQDNGRWIKRVQFKLPLNVEGEGLIDTMDFDGDEIFYHKSHTVETVCLLSKLSGAKNTIDVKVDMDELDVTSAETKATYEEIKEYVLEQTGLQVSNLYVAQVKRECGIIERENYNKPKSEDSRQPQCPEEKRKAIMEALKHFGMV